MKANQSQKKSTEHLGDAQVLTIGLKSPQQVNHMVHSIKHLQIGLIQNESQHLNAHIFLQQKLKMLEEISEKLTSCSEVFILLYSHQSEEKLLLVNNSLKTCLISLKNIHQRLSDLKMMLPE